MKAPKKSSFFFIIAMRLIFFTITLLNQICDCDCFLVVPDDSALDCYTSLKIPDVSFHPPYIHDALTNISAQVAHNNPLEENFLTGDRYVNLFCLLDNQDPVSLVYLYTCSSERSLQCNWRYYRNSNNPQGRCY